jgi:hypothetical protein
MSHRTLLTAANVVVNHGHYSWDYTAVEKANYQAAYLASYSGIQPVHYVHLDHSSDELLPTTDYNCWGFTFNPRQCWISSGNDVQNILNGNGTQVFAPNIRIGDVICYRDSGNVITHTGRVWSVNSSGQANLIQSKWGKMGEYLHLPLTVPSSYGTNVTYWRVTPLSGKGDAWHKDNNADDRLPFPPGVKWLSPDLWCNNSGGTTHQNPIRGQANQLYARLHNPDTLQISNATIRIYWADPNGGIPHNQWNSIGTALVTVSPGASAIAGPVAWTPGPSVPNHACLLAIADTGDDPFASATLDPIVWPFSVARDNNVIQKNISVVALPPAPSPSPLPLPFVALNPHPVKMPIEVRVNMGSVEPKDLIELSLDLKTFQTEFEKISEEHAPPLPVVRLRPTPFQALFLFLAEIIKFLLRLIKVIPPKPITLELQVEDVFHRTKGGFIQRGGLHLTTAPVSLGGGGRMELMLTPAKHLKPGQCYRIDIEQRVGGEITGGMTYIIVVSDRD